MQLTEYIPCAKELTSTCARWPGAFTVLSTFPAISVITKSTSVRKAVSSSMFTISLAGFGITLLDGNDLPVKVITAPPILRRCLDGAEDPVRGHRRWIAGLVLQAGDVFGLEMHIVHVGGTGADILSGYVAAAETLDEPPMRPEDRLAILRSIVTYDDRLSAAEIESGTGRDARSRLPGAACQLQREAKVRIHGGGG